MERKYLFSKTILKFSKKILCLREWHLFACKSAGIQKGYFTFNFDGNFLKNGNIIWKTTQETFKRRISAVDQRWYKVDPMLKMIENPTSDFQTGTTLIQRQLPTIKQF